MSGNFGGGGDKFRSANQNLQRPVAQLGAPQVQQMPIGKDMRGNVSVASPLPDVAPAVIGKGAQGPSGQVPLRVVGGQSPFGHEMGGGPQMAPMQVQQPRFQAPAPQPQAPQPQNPGLGANEELHVLVATLEGPGGQRYEAVYEVVSPRGSKVLGVSERPY